MDITALLSPGGDGNATDTTPPDSSPKRTAASPHKRRRRPEIPSRTSSGLVQEVLRSPDREVSDPSLARQSLPSTSQLPTITESGLGQYKLDHEPLIQNIQADGNSHAMREQYDSAQHSPTRLSIGSTSGGLPLLDNSLKLGHSAQQSRESFSSPRPLPMSRTNSANGLRRLEFLETQRSPSLMPPSMPGPMMRTHSGQSLADLTMAEAPAQTPPPRSFASANLTVDESRTVNDMLRHLSDHSFDYDTHVRLINLLHKGFLTFTQEQPEADPNAYELLAELRQARDAMDSRFAVGEALLVDWLRDEALLARSGEERLTVTELFQKAVGDEPASLPVWLAYIDWIESNFAACHNPHPDTSVHLSADDQELCRELFTREMLLDALEQAKDLTRWRFDQSHHVWNRWAAAQEEAITASRDADGLAQLRDAYEERLQTPHSAWNETRDMFWRLLQHLEGSDWEATMAQINEVTEPVRKQIAAREQCEVLIQQALDAGDLNALYYQFQYYIEWERNRKPKQRSPFDFNLRCGLYERALLKFPTITDWWLEYVDFVVSASSAASMLPLLERATRHCPWSGDLWAMRILRSDVERRPHADIDATKHRATNSGLVDIGGVGELLKVLLQWCSYLRRHAFKVDSTEDDIDTAEVGITMALEDVEQVCRQRDESHLQAEMLYHLQNIQIKFFTEARRFQRAREIYRHLASIRGHSAEFWSRYYNWELWLWGYERLSEARRVETQENGPHLATAVVQEAISQRNLDFPEMVLDMHLNHFRLHESGEKLELALVRAREFSRALAHRRAREAKLAEEQNVAAPSSGAGNTDFADCQKRRASATTIDEPESKRSRSDEEMGSEQAAHNEIAAASPTTSNAAQAKRDREHNTITLRGLAPDVTDLDIKKFFRDVGQPLSINILQGTDDNHASATVEFASHDDVLAAKTRTGKDMKGHPVRISSGSQSTLYVTNYPAEYDEASIRGLFESYGEIVSVRFPSLKFNSRRRFCYVSFLTAESAKDAEISMDGKLLDNVHKLVAKISDPDAKKQRSGAQAEGREIFIKNLDFKTTEAEVKTFFSEYGTVLSMHLIKNKQGKMTGSGFVVFSSSDEANRATSVNKKPFKDRILHVEIAAAKGGAPTWEKSRKDDIMVKHATPTDNEHDQSRRDSDVSMNSNGAVLASDQGDHTARERSAAIINLPDTVNDARIRLAMEQHGPIVKIQLRRREGGAIVEFANLKDAFNVRQGVDCSTLGEGVSTGDVADLLSKSKPQALTTNVTTPAMALKPAQVSRPGQARVGRRGGLGFKRGGAGQMPEKTASNGSNTATANGGKNNADFRAMLDAGRKKETKTLADSHEA